MARWFSLDPAPDRVAPGRFPPGSGAAIQAYMERRAEPAYWQTLEGMREWVATHPDQEIVYPYPGAPPQVRQKQSGG